MVALLQAVAEYRDLDQDDDDDTAARRRLARLGEQADAILADIT